MRYLNANLDIIIIFFVTNFVVHISRFLHISAQSSSFNYNFTIAYYGLDKKFTHARRVLVPIYHFRFYILLMKRYCYKICFVSVFVCVYSVCCVWAVKIKNVCIMCFGFIYLAFRFMYILELICGGAFGTTIFRWLRLW